MREITKHEWSGFQGAVAFPDGSSPRVKELEIVDEGKKHDAVMIVGGESVQIHWTREVRCSSCLHYADETRYVTHRLYDGDVGSPAPTPEIGEILAFQLKGQANEVKLLQLGFSLPDSC